MKTENCIVWIMVAFPILIYNFCMGIYNLSCKNYFPCSLNFIAVIMWVFLVVGFIKRIKSNLE